MTHSKVLDTLRRWILLIIIVLLGIVFAASSGTFLKPANLLNIVRQTSIMSILAIGITFVIVAGEIDLSFSSIVSMSAVLMLTMAINASTRHCHGRSF